MSKTATLLVLPGVLMVVTSAGNRGDGWTAFGLLLLVIGFWIELRANDATRDRLERIEEILKSERTEHIPALAAPVSAIGSPLAVEPAQSAARNVEPPLLPISAALDAAVVARPVPAETAGGAPEQTPLAHSKPIIAASDSTCSEPLDAVVREAEASAPTANVIDVIADLPAAADPSLVSIDDIAAHSDIAAFVVTATVDAPPPAPTAADTAADRPFAASPGFPGDSCAILTETPKPASAGTAPSATPAAPLPNAGMDAQGQSPMQSRQQTSAEGEPPLHRSLLDFEQILGVNWLSKVGVAILVIGVSFFLAWQLRELGPLGKVVVGTVVGLVLLGAGIWAEGSRRYRILARASLAGGWALLFFVSYATNHVAAARVIASPLASLALMLAVAAAMVMHTLRFRSQVVTGLAFALAFLTIASNRAAVASLSANVVLAVGFSIVVVRMRWFRLELIGIVATYVNHALWLRPIVEPMNGKVQPFPEFYASTAILVLYWAIFRVAHVVRRPPDEKTSALGGMLNTALLLLVMKYQPAYPELAFWLLLALGAAEIALARLPLMRAKRMSFIVLTTVGAALISAAIPFRYSPGYVTPVWLIDAILFAAVGILTGERVYRRLGTLVLGATTLQLLSFPAAPVLGARLDGSPAVHEWALGSIGIALTIALYAESVWLPRRWYALFDQPLDQRWARMLGYAAAAVGLLSGWFFFPASGTALFAAVFAIVIAAAARRLRTSSADLTTQAMLVAASAVFGAVAVNLPSQAMVLSGALPLSSRLVTVTTIAALLYVLSRVVPRDSSLPVSQLCRVGTAWAGTLLLTLLAWYELQPVAVAFAWTIFCVSLAGIGRRFHGVQLMIQANAIAAVAIGRVLTVNLPANEVMINDPLRLTWRMLTVIALSAALYLLSRWNESSPSTNARGYVIAPLWAGTTLLLLLAWYEVVPVAVATAWTLLALGLAAVGRRFDLPHLSLQANVITAIVIARVLTVNFRSNDSLLTDPLHLTWRLLTVTVVVAVLYLLSRWNSHGSLTGARAFTVVPLWAAAALLVVLAGHEIVPNAVVIAWTVIAFALAFIGRRFRSVHFMLQANFVAGVAIARVLALDLPSTSAVIADPIHVTWRLLSVAGLAALLYSLSHWNALGDFMKPPGHSAVPRAAASALLMLLAWNELQPVAVVIAWSVLGGAFLVVGRRFRLRDVSLHANAAGIAVLVSAVVINLPSNAIAVGKSLHLSWRLLGVPAATALLYALSRWNVPEALMSEAFLVSWSRTDSARGDYARPSCTTVPMYAGTALLLLLGWYELRPASVAVGWTILAVALLQIGSWRGSQDLLIQSYVIVAAVFARVFVVNMNVDDGGALGARAYTIAPIVVALLYFHRRTDPSRSGNEWQPSWVTPTFASLALICLTALLRFELAADGVVVAWAVLAAVLTGVAAFGGPRVFLHIGLAVALASLARGVIHNVYERSYFPSPGPLNRWLYIGVAAAALVGSLPFAFRLRSIEVVDGERVVLRLARWLDSRPEQTLFFIPLVLVTTLIGTEMRTGMLTVGWGLEAVAVFVFAVWVRERSYRLSGIGLLLLCVAKIFVLDFWSLTLRDKALTGIIMGLALIGVSLLYSRKREAILQFL